MKCTSSKTNMQIWKTNAHSRSYILRERIAPGKKVSGGVIERHKSRQGKEDGNILHDYKDELR